MSLTTYQQMQTLSDSDPELFGCTLPTMHAQSLEPTFQQVSITEALAILAKFQPEQGWYMRRDAVLMGIPDSSCLDLIEGEWCRSLSSNTQTLTVKLLGPNCYGVTVYQPVTDSTGSFAYHDQAVFVRQHIEGTASKCRYAHYRIWWACEKEGVNQGRWQPFSQQFIGFTQEVTL